MFMVCLALAYLLCGHVVVNLRDVRHSYDWLVLPKCIRTEKPLRPSGYLNRSVLT